MNKKTGSIQECDNAGMHSNSKRSAVFRCSDVMFTIRSARLLFALTFAAVFFGCSGPIKSSFLPLRNLLSAKDDSAIAPESEEQKAPGADLRVLKSTTDQISDVTLASYNQEAELPLEHLPAPVVADDLEKIYPLEHPGSIPPGNHAANIAVPANHHSQKWTPRLDPRLESQRSLAIKMQGNLLRDPNATATEISLQQKKVIAFLEQQIETGKADRQQLERQLTVKRAEHQRTENKLASGLKEIIRLRKLTAKLQVQIDDLNVENKRIRDESELALKDIETNLDAALLQTISGKRGN